MPFVLDGSLATERRKCKKKKTQFISNLILSVPDTDLIIYIHYMLYIVSVYLVNFDRLGILYTAFWLNVILLKGTTINDLGGGPEEIEKKKFLAALLREKKISGSPTLRKKISGISLLREKKILGPFLIGLYKEKNFFGVHLWEKKFLGSLLEEKNFFGKPP